VSLFLLRKKREKILLAYKYKTKPYEHQKDALEKSWSDIEHALFLEMGCGKSKILIDNIAILYNQGKIDSALIVAPKGVYDNWVSGEFPLHLPDYIESKVIKWSPSETKGNKELRESALEHSKDLIILVMNVEAFSTVKGAKFAGKFLLSKRALFAIDESTTIKSPSAKRTKNIVRLSKYAEYRRILTGSPVTRSPLDLYTQCEFLDPELLGFTSFYSFRARYAEMINRSAGGRTFKQVVGYKNLDELTKSLHKFSSRILKKDCLDLPDKIYITRKIELTPEQKKVYDEIKKYAITDLYDEQEQRQQVSVTSVLTKMLRLHQISCGYTTTDLGENIELTSTRLNELMSILEETEGKAIIWANYRYDIKRIVNEIKKVYGDDSVGSYYGDTSDDNRVLYLKQFQDVKSPLRFMVGNTQTGGYGINLTKASTVIYYSNNFDLEKRLQSEDRAHRIGQVNKVTYIDIVCKGTVDEKIVKSLLAKQNIAAQVLGEEAWKDWIR
jgi:SNF2 family DNA or RNA helicase|tara:strand:- start:12637 stop:14133 length:1497 start_codon:yes stop_codon:yes gene_type:complete